jgi:Fuc2NAc and GlcNAc transferase
LSLLFVGALLLLGSYAGVEVVRRYAIRRRVLDVPGPRSSHSVPTPRGGGIVIVLATLVSLIVAAVLEPVGFSPAVLVYLAGGMLVAGVGWLDDVRSLSAGARMAAHFAAAALLLFVTGWWSAADLPLAGTTPLGWFALPLALVWIVGMTNAYNFMDGIDGIAGGQAVVAGTAWAAMGWVAGIPVAMWVGLAVALSSLAFLLHNWSPARIFMGDAGSGFLGFTFAALPFLMLGRTDDWLLRLPVAATLVVWPFVFDAAFTLIRRLLRGEHVFQAHRSHLYQRLVLGGWSHAAVAALYIALAAAGAALAAAWLRGGRDAHLIVAGSVLVLATQLVTSVWCRERRTPLAG